MSKIKSKTDYSVVIIGAGFSGLGMAIKLSKAGIEDYLVIEAASEVGGTWRDAKISWCRSGCSQSFIFLFF